MSSKLTEAQSRRLDELYSKVQQAHFHGKLRDWAREHGFDAPQPLTDEERREFRQLHLVLWGKKDGEDV